MRFEDLFDMITEEEERLAGERDFSAKMRPVEDFLVKVRSAVEDGTAPFVEDDLRDAAEIMIDEIRPDLDDSEIKSVEGYAAKAIDLAVAGKGGELFGFDAGFVDKEIRSAAPRPMPGFTPVGKGRPGPEVVASKSPSW